MSQRKWSGIVFCAAMHGAAAWCAYAAVEFFFSSVLYAVSRPYTEFTSWHWQLTALLTCAFAAAGLLAGGLAGASAHLAGRTSDAAIESAATFTVVLAFAINAATAPVAPIGRTAMVAASLLFAVLLALRVVSARWAERARLLTNPWVISGLLLGLGQEFALADLRLSAEQFGAKYWLSVVALAAILVATVAASLLFGRRLRPLVAPRSLGLSYLSWGALVAALLILGASLALSRRPDSPASGPAVAFAQTERPNLALIVLDTVRASHVSALGYGRKTTPNLESLARDSVVYTRAIAPSDITLSSHASLFTGLYPSWHGAHCQPPQNPYGSPIGEKYKTLAEILTANGYQAYGASANVYLRREFGLQRGFSEFRIPRPVPVLPSESWYLLRAGMRQALSTFVDTAQFDRLFARGDDVNLALFDLMRAQPPGDKPFFAFLNYMDAHFPYVPPAPFDRLFPGKQRGLTRHDMERTAGEVSLGAPFPAAEHAHRISQYDGGIAFDDAQVGEIVRWLKNRNLYDRTMIVVTSDHGEAFGEKSRVLHGNSAYQASVHVPLIIKYARGGPAGVVDRPVSLVDVVPTALAAFGIGAPQGLHGVDLASGEMRPRELLSESFPCPVAQPRDCPTGCTVRAAFAWPWKYIASSNGRRELYNLEDDPHENSNRLAFETNAGEALRKTLAAWVTTMPAQSGRKTVMDAESVQRLKSLGYVQ